MKLKLVGTALSIALLSACAAPHIDPADRDVTGTYDGNWIARVEAPTASKVFMPGNNIMNCGWEPYEFPLTIKEGRVLASDKEFVVSTEGNFRFDRTSGTVSLRNGVLPGNDNEIIGIYSGNLAGSEPGGKFVQYIPTLGGNGCSAKMQFRRS